MPESSRRRNTVIALVVILLLILLLLVRCSCKPAVPGQGAGPAPSSPVSSSEPEQPAIAAPAGPDEVLTPATVTVSERVTAGAVFSVAWTGPDNAGDFLTIVRSDAPSNTHGGYRETRAGTTLELTAPLDPGAHEVRYVTARSRTILGRAPIEVGASGATLDAAAEIVLGAQLSVAWTGPDNRGDYITIVPKGTPDGQYDNYTSTDEGSPLTVRVPTVTGEAELRYMTGQGNKVLARRPVRIVMADVALSAPTDAVAGSTIEVTWTGPNNPGDYITAVPKSTPDGQYGNYTDTAAGSPLKMLMPILPGEVELRYVAAQGNRVLGRRPIEIVAAEVTLSAPAEAAAGSDVTVTWKGPNNPGDYITAVPRGAADGQYGDYTATTAGSPLTVKVPKGVGGAEIRYVSGQGNKVLARRPIQLLP